ncbi:MAG: hypothetical protein ACK5YR_16580 [Pirellula sp.]
MKAYFYQNKHIGIWQNQINDPTWITRTAQSLGHNLNYVEIYECPAIRSDEPYFFDENKCLVTQKEIVDFEGNKIVTWNTPIILEKLYPING